MSGIYIPNMKKPTKCGECPCFCEEYYYCKAADIEDAYYSGAPDDCPLVPVPPHGRLVDARYIRDAIIQKWMDKAGDSHMYKCGMEDAYEVIRNAPTIIPAEEDE